MNSIPTTNLDHLLTIWEAAVRATHHFLPEEEIRQLRPLVRNTYLPHVDVLTAKDDRGRVQGFLGLRECGGEEKATGALPAGGPAGMIEMLFVHPTYHGKGMGRSLIQEARARFHTLLVDVNEQNPGALAFYKRCGFVIRGCSPLDGQGNPYPLLHMSLT